MFLYFKHIRMFLTKETGLINTLLTSSLRASLLFSPDGFGEPP